MWLCILLYIVLQSRRLFLFSSSFSWFNGRSGSGKLAKRRGVKYSKSCSGLLCPHIPSNPIYRAVPLLQASSFLCCHAELCAMCGVGKGEVEKKWMEWGRKKSIAAKQNKKAETDQWRQHERASSSSSVCRDATWNWNPCKSIASWSLILQIRDICDYESMAEKRNYYPPKRWHTNPL